MALRHALLVPLPVLLIAPLPPAHAEDPASRPARKRAAANAAAPAPATAKGR